MGANFCKGDGGQEVELFETQFYEKYPRIYQTLQKIKLPDTIVDRSKYRAFKDEGMFVGGETPVRKAYGIMYYINEGMYYIGKWASDKRDGYGIMINSDGSYYDGEWYRDKPHGKGTYYNEDHTWSYTGRWKTGEICGDGMETYPDGTIFRGFYKQNKKNGKGKFQFGGDKNCYFKGNFVNDKAQERGEQRGKDYIYEGEWLNSQMNGVGRCQYFNKNGEKEDEYIGQYRESQKHGYGEYSWKNGQIYKGQWEKGQVKSVGLFIRKDCGLNS